MAKSRGMMPAGRHGQNSGCHSMLAAGSMGKEAAGDAMGTGQARSGRAWQWSQRSLILPAISSLEGL